MKKICSTCNHFGVIEDNSLYRKPYDGHCKLTMDLVFADDECDVDGCLPPEEVTLTN